MNDTGPWTAAASDDPSEDGVLLFLRDGVAQTADEVLAALNEVDALRSENIKLREER